MIDKTEKWVLTKKQCTPRFSIFVKIRFILSVDRVKSSPEKEAVIFLQRDKISSDESGSETRKACLSLNTVITNS